MIAITVAVAPSYIDRDLLQRSVASTVSYGMLDFLWPSSAKYDKAPESKLPASLPVSATSVLTKAHSAPFLKRKRGHSIPTLDHSRRSDAPSHVRTVTSQTSFDPTVLGRGPPRNDSLQDKETSTHNVSTSHPRSSHPDLSILSDPARTTSLTDPPCSDRLTTTHDMDISRLRNAIDSQFNLEILLKHRELRLIDQELAKCQVGLEQLRRCQTIPYPSQLANAANFQVPSDAEMQTSLHPGPPAPPWGVANAAYSIHYEKWLLDYPTSEELNTLQHSMPAKTGKRLPDRLTRGVHTEKGFYGSSSRAQRGSSTASVGAAPFGHPETRDEKGPMIVPRKSDGHLVKLICLDCARSNFNSVQGFINHCRIAHTRQFASHEAAIEASGEEVDNEREGTANVETNIVQRGPASVGLVHPMIRAARPPTPDAPSSPAGDITPTIVSENTTLLNVTTSTPERNEKELKPSKAGSFKPSPRTPHLSTFLSKMGQSGDLDAMVLDAKDREETELLEMLAHDSSEDEMDAEIPQENSNRGVSHCSMRPVSSASSEVVNDDKTPGRRPIRPTADSSTPNFTQTNGSGFENMDGSSETLGSPFDLSPNTTDPHPAPSLVSDDDDYDNTHSESDYSSQMDVEENDHFVHANIVDGEELDLGETSRLSFPQPGKPHGAHLDRRPRSPTLAQDGGYAKRHVTFASPVRRRSGSARMHRN